MVFHVNAREKMHLDQGRRYKFMRQINLSSVKCFKWGDAVLNSSDGGCDSDKNCGRL